MTQTWTDNDRDRIVKYLNLTRDYYALIESTLTTYETTYGVSAITEVQSKLDELDAYKTTIDGQMTDGSIGVTSVAVTGFHSYSQTGGSNIRATMTLYKGDQQWLIDNLQLQNYASLSGKHTRA
jgi:hypothetical protein